MPTLNEYANDDGYYILARPSDTGNITYQLKPRGEQIVEKVGYQDGEEIGWQVINALKVPNLVYTGDEGTTEDDISVDLGKEEIDALSEEDAKELLDELSFVPRVGESQTEEIEEILGVEGDLKADSEDFARRVKSVIEGENVVEESRQKNISSSSTSAVPMSSLEYKNSETRMDGISIDFEITYAIDIMDKSKVQQKKDATFMSTRGGGWVEIHLLINRNRGIVEYSSTITREPQNVGRMLNYQRFLSEVLSAIIKKVTSIHRTYCYHDIDM